MAAERLASAPCPGLLAQASRGLILLACHLAAPSAMFLATNGQSAEYCFMTMAMLQREIRKQDTAMRHGDWSGGVFPDRAARPNLLIIGLGHIGAEVARWGNFYGMNVTGLTRSPTAGRGDALGLDGIGQLDELDAYLPQSDFVVVAIPNTPETAGTISQPQLQAMKSTAFLINVARGPLVDEQSLYEALRDNSIAGAAIDVWYRYPGHLAEICQPATYPFHELDNVIMTPHNAGTTNGTMDYRFKFMAANIDRFYRGEQLENVVALI